MTLEHVAVQRVLSDRVFTVTAGSAELFVMLDNRLNQGAAEKAIEVRPAQMVSLDGVFHDVADEQTKDEQGRGLNRTEFHQMQGQQVYVSATGMRNAN